MVWIDSVIITVSIFCR